MSHRIAGLLYRWRRWLSALIILGAIALAPRASITRIDNDLTAWFSREDPVYREYERFRDEFGGTRTFIAAIEAPTRERLLSRESFDFITAATAEIERVQMVERVNSLATITVVDARPAAAGTDADLLDVRRLTKDLETLSPAEVGQRALDDELIRGDLISEDGMVTAIVVSFDERRVDEVRAEAIARIKAIVDGKLPKDFRALYNGSLEISETYNRVTLDNQQKFTPPILICTLAALYVLFRSWRQTVLTLVAVLVSVVWTLGLYDLMGFNFNVLSSMIVPLIVVLAIADDVHIIQYYGEERRRTSSKDAFISTVRHLFAPLLAASGTTALGMASLATSQVVAVREFGLGSAVGVMVDFAISIVLVPTLLGWLKPETREAPQQTWLTGPMIRVAQFSTRRAGVVLAISAVVMLCAAAGLSKLRVDTNHINFFARDHPLSQSAAVIDGRLAGIYTFQVFLEGPPDALKQPDALARMDRLETELRTLPFVKKVTGLVDYVRRAHRELASDTGPPSANRLTPLPTDVSVVAQELFVLGLSDDGRAELERVASSDFSKGQITVKLASMSSDLVFAQIETAEKIAAGTFAGSGISATVTGSGRLFSTLDHYLVISQISSFATAFVAVFAVIFVIFRSWRFGLLAIIPNLFPVLAIFGVMGWMNISLNVATIMLASVALGVVDDDTIHFISRYRRETRDGRSAHEAILIATTHEGRASLTTALINSCAFAVLSLSAYKPTAWFGGLLALTLLVAFLAEVFILPATIVLMPRLFGATEVHGARRLERDVAS